MTAKANPTAVNEPDAIIHLKDIVIERRLERHPDAEVWIVDGHDKDGNSVFGAGMLVVIYKTGDQEPRIIGSLESNYDLRVSEEEVWKLLSRSLSNTMCIEAGDLFFTWKSGTVDCSWE